MISDRATDLFMEALELEPKQRLSFLTETCRGDSALRSEVELLLNASPGAESYFNKLASKVSLSALADEPDLSRAHNKIIGSWRLLRLLGRGGMGAVYFAERADQHFEQQAALKILPLGLDSESARARFLSERQILARLVHDNIARLLDGGVTEDGLPYFVMDYVEGLPIDEYCERHQLDINARLRLILDVAVAVQFAHRNLIVHRDLKPSNVLVDERGQVRLLDFGIAKVLQRGDDLHAELTQAAQRPLTPAYASPEMLRGESVDVTTDVYSIGALSYLLLCGKHPLDYEGLSISEIYKKAANTDPEPISNMNPRLAGDLEAIVSKALAKSPGERYESVQSLASDLHNYLAGLPVSAKTPSMIYRGRKFIGRHRLAVAFSTFAILALASIAGVAVRSAQLSDQQARRIEIERDRAEQTKEFLISIFKSADPNIVPGQQTALEILEAGRLRIEDELDGQPEIQADLLRSMGSVYQNWRRTTEGRAVLEKELHLRERVNGANSTQYLETLVAMAYITEIQGDYASSIAYAEQARDRYANLGDVMGRAKSHERIGRVLHLQGDYDGAEDNFNAALTLIRSHKGNDAMEASYIREHLANLASHREQYEKALEEFRASLEVRRKGIAGDSSEISSMYLGMGTALSRLGRLDEAREAYETGLAINARLFGADNSYRMYFVSGLGTVAEAQGNLAAAVELHEEARRLILRDMPESPNLGFAYFNLGKLHRRNGDCGAATPALQAALAIFEAKLPAHWIAGNVRWQLGLCLIERGAFEEAERAILAGLKRVEAQWGPNHENTQEARRAVVRLYEAWGKPGHGAGGVG